METYSEIQITFNLRFTVGKYIQFLSELSGNPSATYLETWVNLRQGLYQVSTPIPFINPEAEPGSEDTDPLNINISAQYFLNSFLLDYGTTLFEATRIDNVVTIKCKNPFITFNTPTSNGDVDFSITNYDGEVPELDYEISEADENPCENIKVTINSSVLINSVEEPFVLSENTNNPIVFDWPRQQSFTFIGIVEDYGGVSIFVKPPYLLNQFGTYNVAYYDTGSSITVNVINHESLLVEYSLDGEVWQESNVFSGLEAGTYTVYIRDQYGCQKTVQENIVIVEPGQTSLTNPFFYISKSNSIRFANRITFGDSANYKTDENTLSCETDVEVPYMEVQPFQSADVITTQIKSNYSENLLTVIQENAVPTEAKSNMLLYSEDLTNAIWTKTRVNIDENKVIANDVFNKHRISQNITKDAVSGNYTFSCFVKKDEFDIITMGIYEDGGSAQSYTAFNITTESFLFGFAFSGFTFVGSSFTNEGGGFYRISMTITLNDSTDILLRLDLHNQSGDTVFTGNNSDGILIDKLQFQEGDLTPYIQTTSTPQSVEATDGNTVIPFIKKTNNIGVKDKRDARKFNLGNGKTGIYFVSGNNYDYDTNVVTGTYNLFGALPLFGKVGNIIFFDGNWYTISGTSYSDEKNAEVLEVDGIYTGADVATIVSCVYNLFNYEVYEAVIDMVNFLDETIQVRINANDAVFQDLVYLSEKINVKVRHQKTVCVDYWSEENTDIFYQTGIKNRIRLFLNRKDSLLEHESEIHKTDSNTKMLSASIIEGDEFTFEPVSKEIMRKLCEALTHPFLFLDNVAYTLNGSPEVEGPLERSNLHIVKAKLLKSGESFRNDGTAFGFDTSSSEIPGLVESESGFIKY